jgi:hypothetical protein
MQSEIIHIILDISGSMQEMGKLLLARNLVTFIREFSEFRPDKLPSGAIQLLSWSDTIQPVELRDDCETPIFHASGSSDLIQLKEFFQSVADDMPQVKVLILSDGHISITSLKKFKLFCKEQPHITIRTVAVGADSANSTLRKLSTNNCVFLSEDISVAIQSLIGGTEDPIERPTSVNDITLDSAQTEEEAWD